MPYAIVRDGQPVEITEGQPFTTTQFKVTTEEEAAWAFSPVGSVIDMACSHAGNALDHYGPDDLARYMIHHFDVPEAPEGKSVSYELSMSSGDSGAIMLAATLTD